MKKSKFIKIMIFSALIICMAVGIFVYFNSSKFEYNNENAVGNTTGNLNNGGLFCEYDGKIYFANPYDSDYLYVMNSDCTEPKHLNNDCVSSLNVCGNYIYYVKNNLSRTSIDSDNRSNFCGVYRTDLKGQEAKSLYETLSGISSLSGNYLYYQHYDDSSPLCLYRVKIDGTEETKVSDTPFNPSSINNGKIYYSDPNNKNNITSYDTKTGSISSVFGANAYLVDATDNYIYYIDLDKNYSLVRLNSNTKTIELLYEATDGKVINFNRYGNKIFFQVEGTNAGLYRMNINGTQIEKIASGNLRHVHCTSQYTFFQYYEDNQTLYRVPTTGTFVKVEEITIK